MHDFYDSDDSLPTSPKPKLNGRLSSRPSLKQLYRHFLRSRALVLLAAALFALYYYSTYLHRCLFRPTHAPSLRYKNVNWRYYAYSQYATDSHYLCNSVMVFEALQRLGSRAERILMYPEEWDTDVANKDDRDSQLLLKARNEYGAKLLPVKVKKFRREGEVELGEDDLTWDTSLTKLLAFNQTQYLRILHLDSDVTIQHHLDDLFLLPSTPVAMMRAYWSSTTVHSLTSLLILLEPSAAETARLMTAADSPSRQPKHFDMEILNSFYSNTAMVLPHRMYGLLSGEFRSTDHTAYLGNDYEKWDAKRALREASLVHFSDWPLPKPWIMWPQSLMRDMKPHCEINPGMATEAGCESREVWVELYNEFRRRRKDVCALLSVPAPEWPPRRRGNRTGMHL